MYVMLYDHVDRIFFIHGLYTLPGPLIHCKNQSFCTYSDLVVASIKSVCMTHISASDLCYRVEFSYDHDQLEADHFRVIATPTSAEPEGILAVQIDNPYCRQAELRLIPGTKYSLAVMTYYTNSIIQPQKSKEDILVPVPMLQEGKDVTKFNISTNYMQSQ